SQLGPRVVTISDTALRNRQVDKAGVVTFSCDPSTPITQCNPNDSQLKDSRFTPRPTGGTSLIEASVELRIPLAHRLDGAVFVDGAIVGNSSLVALSDIKTIADFAHSTSAITPGAGIRYNSPV